MNFNLKHLPTRSKKPREKGLTMMIDKGLSLSEIDNLIETSYDYVDLVKFGWGTAVVTKNLKEKIKKYQDNNLPVFFGGTLFELFVARGQFEDYMRFLDEFGLTHVEISDGSLTMPTDQKLEYIHQLSKNYKVLSEVGTKNPNKVLAAYQWVSKMKSELEAGSWKVIAEARESGTTGVYESSGQVREGLIEEILNAVKGENIIWEAPKKAQQVWFIKLLGENVNLGNIQASELIPLETIRLGLRGDTFFHFLPQEIKDQYQ